MKFLTLEEVRKCCESYGIKITSNRFLKYETENPTCLSIGLEEKPSRVIALADYLVPTWDVYLGGGHFCGFDRGTFGATFRKKPHR